MHAVVARGDENVICFKRMSLRLRPTRWYQARSQHVTLSAMAWTRCNVFELASCRAAMHIAHRVLSNVASEFLAL